MPDPHKKIAESVRSKSERDAAARSLRQVYQEALKGTEWEVLSEKLQEQADPVDPLDPIEFYEVEMRPVAVVWPEVGMGHAWVWRDASANWGSAPGLVNKSWLEGEQFSRSSFVRKFPKADLTALEVLVSGIAV